MYMAKEQQRVVVVDEIGRSLHPNLLRKIVRSFLEEPKTNGQLIFTSHEDRLLDLRIFRQDEIWFAEKDKKGATHLKCAKIYLSKMAILMVALAVFLL